MTSPKSFARPPGCLARLVQLLSRRKARQLSECAERQRRTEIITAYDAFRLIEWPLFVARISAMRAASEARVEFMRAKAQRDAAEFNRLICESISTPNDQAMPRAERGSGSSVGGPSK